ncbi:TetR/AcrR family transcriptional regulator [Marinobacter changyiensis]|uniref:TetR/AcrR family transcriptional regulator n=1 Tax=Marinobacter changyiensis TaxID=2604091 RepID=UPI0012654913|nr:TetR/AcrR family transcriptional regulator [Marinobacter changyiensis]
MIMKPTPPRKKAIRKRNALLHAVFGKLSSQDFAGTTAKSLADGAGVATGPFCQYFHNRDDVPLEVTRQRFANLQQHQNNNNT